MKQSSRKEANSFQIKTPDAPVRWNRLDVLLLCTLLLVYGILSFVHLGDRNAPQTFIRHTKNDDIVVTLEQPSEVAKVNFFRGPDHHRLRCILFTGWTAVAASKWGKKHQCVPVGQPANRC